MYRPRFSYGYDTRRVAQRMPQFPVYVQGAQYVPMGVTQYSGNYGQYRPQYYQRPVTVQQNYDVREVIRQDILHQLQPSGQAYGQQIVSGPVLASRSGQSGSDRKRAREEEDQNDTPKRLKTTESTKHATLAAVLEKNPQLYKSPTPSPNGQITQSIIEYFIKNHQTEDCYKRKIQLRDALYAIMQGVFPNSGLYIVGSSMSGFGTQNSDMDICLMISRKQIDQSKEAPELLYLIQRALTKCNFLKQLLVIRAKVPILRFTDMISKVECDLNINNVVGIRNTHLLKYYCLLDWRVRPLVLFIKHWARFHDINDARKMTMSSYSLGLMILHYLQSCTPPVLPSLQKLHPDKFSVRTDVSTLRLDHKIDFRSENTDTVGDLFLGFLKYYAKDFDFDHYAISVRCGTKLTIDQFREQMPIENRRSLKCLCIEEPFDLSNTARSCYDVNVFGRVKRVFNVSYNVLNKKRNVDELFKAPF